MTHKIILRDWHNAICKVAVVSDEQLDTIKEIDRFTAGDTFDDSEEYGQILYDQLGEIDYTDDNHRYCTDLTDNRIYDGYYSH